MIKSELIRLTPTTRLHIVRNSVALNKVLLRELSEISTKNEIIPDLKPSSKPEKSFKFTDYDCIGFDLDNTLSQYRLTPTLKLCYDSLADYMVKNKRYSANHLMEEIDHNFIASGLIIDDVNGNLLRLSAGGKILRASHGTKILMNPEISECYASRRWKVTDAFIKDPLLTWHGNYWQKMYPVLDIFDMPASLVFARCVDTLDIANEQKNYGIWPDLLEAIHQVYDTKNFYNGESVFYRQITSDPRLYYHETTKEVIQWLQELRQKGKVLFLVTSSCKEFGEHTAKMTLGLNWQDLFDVVVYGARKPGFFTLSRPFISSEGSSQIVINSSQNDGASKVNYQGNFALLYEFLKSRFTKKQDLKLLYIGDNLLHDVYAPGLLTECDTVFVCPELETEGFLGYERRESQDNMFSFIWGSFFCDGKEMTNWCSILKKHSQLCVPSLEYVASWPVNYEYRKDHLNL